MKLNKSLTATVTAAALVGALGLAYAQSTPYSAAPADSKEPSAQAPATPAVDSSTMNASPTGGSLPSSTSPSPAAAGAFHGEKAPQADRG